MAWKVRTASPVLSARVGKMTVVDAPGASVTVSVVTPMGMVQGVSGPLAVLNLIYQVPVKVEAFWTRTWVLKVSDWLAKRGVFGSSIRSFFTTMDDSA